MKNTMFVMLAFAATLAVPAFGSSAKVTLKWVDDDGNPVPNVQVKAGYEGDRTEDAKTDKNGLCVFKGKTYCGEIAYSGRLDGYYYSRGRYKFSAVTNGDWQPWNPVVTRVVRKIVNPIPMYAKMADTHIPGTNEWFGYDLMIGDWVNPIGRGLIPDFLFKMDGFDNGVTDFQSRLTLQFHDQPDGIQRVSEDYTGSEFTMPRTASEKGYANAWTNTVGYVPGKGFFETQGTSYYMFRIRCVTNEQGKLIQAYYGKLNRPIEFFNASERILRFTYYLNPTPNDRNLEFDRKRSLVPNLGDSETVSKP